MSDGQVTDDCILQFQFCRAPGEVRGTATALSSASGFRDFPDSWRQVSLKVQGRRAYGSKPRRLNLFLLRWVSSHLWLDTSAAFCEYSVPFPWAGICCLGLQSYSRQLCLSREKHYRLYP